MPEDFTGVLIGRWKDGGKCTETSYVKGMIEGQYVAWSRDGTLDRCGTKKKQQQHGLWLFRSVEGPGDSESVTLQQFWEGEPLSVLSCAYSMSHYPDGSKAQLRLILMDSCGGMVVAGTKIEWHPNGQKRLQDSYDVQGRLHGIRTMWYPNGRKVREGSYDHGEETGLWTHWYENGQKELEGSYERGKKVGMWTQWHENGEKSAEAVADEDGKLDFEGKLHLELRVP